MACRGCLRCFNHIIYRCVNSTWLPLCGGNSQRIAGVELLQLVYGLKHAHSRDFIRSYLAWKQRWKPFLDERTFNPITERTTYTHQRLRSAMHSLDFYLPWLFTCEVVTGMPDTNNRIEGLFTDLKKKLAVHAGMSKENRQRFVNGFFLAFKELHKAKRR